MGRGFALALLFLCLPAALDGQERSAVVDSLRAEIAQLRAELDSLRAILEETRDAQAAAQAAAQAQEAENELARLRAAAAAAARGAAADTARPGGEQQFVGRQRSLQSLNPEISVTADLFGAIQEGSAGRSSFVPREFEFAFQSALDPFSRAKIFVGIETPGAEIEPFEAHGEEGEAGHEGEEAHGAGEVHIEEGYVEWVNLPGGFSVKLGRFYQQFGQLNRWHAHALYFQSRSLPHLAFIGEEPLGQTGVSTHWLIPAALGGAYEVTFELTRSSNASLFGESDKLSYLGHVNGFWQLSESVDFDLGLSGIFGDFEHEDESYGQRLYGVEGSLTWAPPAQSRYRGAVLRGGVMVRDPGATAAGASPGSATGLWSMAETLLGQQWRLGGRFDWTENPDDPSESSWLVGPTLTWWQSEWVRIRAEYSHLNRTDESSGLFTLQVTMAMGPHKHETY